jgi:hypothetical protein
MVLPNKAWIEQGIREIVTDLAWQNTCARNINNDQLGVALEHPTVERPRFV